MSASATTSTGGVLNPNSNLNQADFLQLLVTQMTSQDPLNPESDTDFAAQLAQFSSLQESTSAAGSLSAMQASSLIGSTVQVSPGNGKTLSGVVTSVDDTSGSPEIQINGTSYPLNQILSIAPTPTATPSSSSQNN